MTQNLQQKKQNQISKKGQKMSEKDLTPPPIKALQFWIYENIDPESDYTQDDVNSINDAAIEAIDEFWGDDLDELIKRYGDEFGTVWLMCADADWYDEARQILVLGDTEKITIDYGVALESLQDHFSFITDVREYYGDRGDYGDNFSYTFDRKTMQWTREKFRPHTRLARLIFRQWIRDKDFEKLNFKHEKAIKNKIKELLEITQEKDEKFIHEIIKFKDKNVEVSVNLKGDEVDIKIQSES